jgi:tetratricopeptide (TPR) repeat protein
VAFPAVTNSALAARGAQSPLIGRAGELQALAAVLDRAVDYSAPQVVTLLGSRGTGKTRLVEEWAAGIGGRARVHRGRAVSSERYDAVARLLRDRLGIGDGDDPSPRLREVLAEVFGDARTAELEHFIGSFLGASGGDSPFLRLFDEDPRRHDEVARAALRHFIDLDAARGPLVLILDDLHAADDATLTLVEELGEGLAGAPVVIVAVARTDVMLRRPTWTQSAGDTTRIELGNLGPERAGEMLRHVLARCENLPDILVEDAVEMTGGNPRLLEELAAMWLENGSIDTSAEPWRVDASRAAGTELSMSIEQAIEARIAALAPEERDLLEKAAVFGSVFWLSGLVALARVEKGASHATGWTDDGVRAGFEKLVAGLSDRDYVLRLPAGDSSIPGDVEIVWKHNLERDLVSRLTDGERRKRLARIAAQWMEIKVTERSAEQLEFLGQLYEQGGDARRAALAYLGAADKARARYANPQAIELYRRALGLFVEDDVQPRLEALHNLGTVLALVGQNEDAAAQFEAMLRLGWLFDHPSKAGAAHARIGRIHRQRGEYEAALGRFHKARELFERAGDRRGVAATLDDVGIVHWMRGAYPTALDHHRQALAIRRTLGDKRSIALSLANVGRVQNDMGSFQAALERFREALELRRAVGDRSGVVASMVDLGSVHEADGKLEAAHETFSDALKLAKEIGDRQGQAQVLGRIGEVLLAQGKASEAIDALEKAQEIQIALVDRLGQAECSRRLAQACLVLGDRGAGLAHAKRSLDLAEAIGSRVHAGTALRVLAEVAAAGDMTAGVTDVGEAQPRSEGSDAEELFRKAVHLLGEVANDLELARAYRAFAAFRERSGFPAEAVHLRMRADEIFGRLRGAASPG